MHCRPIFHNKLWAAFHLHFFDIIIFFTRKCAVSWCSLLCVQWLVCSCLLLIYHFMQKLSLHMLETYNMVLSHTFSNTQFVLSMTTMYTMAISERRCACFLFQLCTTYAICSFNLFNEQFREYRVDILFGI